MTSTMRRVELRYRPGTDVLIGLVLPADDNADDTAPATVSDTGSEGHDPSADELLEQPDADLSLTWRRRPDGDMLSSFSLLHASRRLPSSDILDLAPTLLDGARRLVHESLTAQPVDDPSVELTLDGSSSPYADAIATSRRSDVSAIDVPRDDLRRRRTIDVAAFDPVAAHDLAEAISRVISAIDHLPSPVTELESHRSSHLLVTLYELADVFRHSAGRVSPGASAAARDAVRGGLPLSRSEQTQLRDILVLVDDPATWPRAVQALASLADSLGRAGR